MKGHFSISLPFIASKTFCRVNRYDKIEVAVALFADNKFFHAINSRVAKANPSASAGHAQTLTAVAPAVFRQL
jgi:hypothetical protein